MNLYAHRLLALILSLAFGGSAWAGGGTAPASLAPPCQRTDCRPAHSQAVRVQGALLQAAALSVASASLGPQGGARSSKGLPRRSQTRLPSWYKRAQAAQLRGQSTPAVASVHNKMPSRARVREAAASHPHRQLRRAAGPGDDIPDITIRSEDHERQGDSRLHSGEGEAVFGLRPPATDSPPGENHIMIGNVSGNISSNHSNAPVRASGGGLSRSGARAVWHAATTLSLISPRRAAPGRSAKSRTAVPTRPHEQLSVPGLRQKDVARRKAGVRVREADGGVQTAHAGKKGKVKDRTQPARPAGGRAGSAAAAVNPFESASSMKTAAPRSEARGAHHRHLVQESMDIEQDALDRQMRDLELEDDVDSVAPDETMGTEGEEVYSTASLDAERARGKRNTCPSPLPPVTTNIELRCVRGSGSFSINITNTAASESLQILHSIPAPPPGAMINVTLYDSYINMRGEITIFDELKRGFPVSLTIRNSKLVSQGLISLFMPESASGTTVTNCDFNLKIEDSKLEAEEGNIILIRNAANCASSTSQVRIHIDEGSRLTATNGDINLVDSPNSTNLDIKINDSDLHATNGNVVLVRDISGSPSNMTLSMNNSNLTASGTPSREVLQAVPVGSVSGDKHTIRIENCHGNSIEAKLTPGASEAVAIAHMGWGPTCGGLNGSTLQQSQLISNRVRASGHAAYASLAGVYRHDANCPSDHSWHLEQSELEANSILASTGRGTGLASLGFVYADDQRMGSVVFDINQKNCRNNRVEAETDSSNAAASFALAQARQGSQKFENACISAVHSGYKEGSSPTQVALYQCGMDENQLHVSSTGSDGSRSLLVSGGCLIFPLSISGSGDIRCTGRSCQDASPACESILTQTDCQVPACGDQMPCTHDSLDALGATLVNPDPRSCVRALFFEPREPSTCKAHRTPEDSTPASTSGSTTPTALSEGNDGSIAALATITGILVPVSGALLGAVVCLACRDKKRSQKAQYPVRDAMELESRFVGEQAADQVQAAAEPSAAQWHKGDGPLDSESDGETSSIAKENIYEGVKDSPSAHF